MATILVIEDNCANMRLISAILETASHTVLQAARASAGIEIARSRLPDLIFMDIQLPGMDGLEATGILKADSATAHIPIVALTAFAMRDDEAKFRAAGCDGYLAKPFDYRDLLALVERILGRLTESDAGDG